MTIRHLCTCLLSTLLALASLTAGPVARAAHASTLPVPPTPQRPVTDTIQGLAVTDPYRWLENGDDPTVQAWNRAQDRHARAYLDHLPQRRAAYDRLHALMSTASAGYRSLYAAGGRLFALYTQPPKRQAMVAVLATDGTATAQVAVDPNLINPAGSTAIDWFVPSPDGTLIAASMSENGSEDGAVHVFEVATGREVHEVVPRVQYPTGGGSLAWRADSSGFWYTRYPGTERAEADRHFYQQVYYHALGDDPAHDRYVFGSDLPKIAEIALDNRRSPHHVLATVANGDGGEFELFAIDDDQRVTQLTNFADQVVAGAIGPDDAVYMVSRAAASRGKLLRLPLAEAQLAQAQVLVPEGGMVMQSTGQNAGLTVVVTKDSIYLPVVEGGPGRVLIFGLDGRQRGELPLPAVATVPELEPLGDGTVYYDVETYLRPPYLARYHEATGKSDETPYVQTSPVHFDDAEVLRVFANSADGTRVPLSIIRRKGTRLDGRNPVLLNGYGGFGVAYTPHFLDAPTRLWLDGGGVFVLANLRGGGEYGEQWHRDGALTHKQNVFDDFAAAARHLIDSGYTTPARLAAMGRSNGGLLMGAALTQHPELFRAVVSLVGIYDVLRTELEPNGMFNTTEYGSTHDAAQFGALYAYSPYHHVKDGTAYPAIYMATGAHDGRVAPWQSRKMVARLQAANPQGRPVYLSINEHAGHGMGSSLDTRISEYADWYGFLLDQLGMKPKR
jgi:prolyl oligopeptidase